MYFKLLGIVLFCLYCAMFKYLFVTLFNVLLVIEFVLSLKTFNRHVC